MKILSFITFSFYWSSMGDLHLDILKYLINFIDNDKDKCHFLMTNKNISKCDFRFNESINIDKITKSLWFDYFTNISLDHPVEKLPLSTNYLKFNKIYCQKQKYINLPTNYLTLDLTEDCLMDFSNFISPSITQLTFINRIVIGIHIEKYIPLSIKTITFIYFADLTTNNYHMSLFIKLIKKNLVIVTLK